MMSKVLKIEKSIIQDLVTLNMLIHPIEIL